MKIAIKAHQYDHKTYDLHDIKWFFRLVFLQFYNPFDAFRFVRVSKVARSGFGFIDRRKSTRPDELSNFAKFIFA